MMPLRALLLSLLCLLLSEPVHAQDHLHVRVITTEFVLPGKLDKLDRLAAEAHVALDRVYVERAPGTPHDWLAGDLLILDTPRPMDLAAVQERLGAALAETRVPWIRVGGGAPAFGNLPPEHGRRLIAYYAAGGTANLRALFGYVRAWRGGGDLAALPPPAPLLARGLYHPSAPRPFATIDDYLVWGRDRWATTAPRIAIAIHAGLISDMETRVIDALIAGSETRGLLPMVFWFEAGDPEALRKVLGPAHADVLVVATHLQNGPARSAEFLSLNIPVLQTVGYRDGDPDAWAKAETGISPRLVAPFLALPESWGVSDPMVIAAVRDGEPVPIPEQVAALLDKAARLAALRHKPAAEKRVALMFWNYPPGEKNVSASNLNVPRSLERLTTALAAAGYDVPPAQEARLIAAAQTMLGAVYHPERLAALIDQGLADTLPLARYHVWLDGLPAGRRDEIIAAFGAPDQQAGLVELRGEKHFVIPRLALGKLALLPQLPRSGWPGADYHDTKQPPGHYYLAAYLYVREVFGADALVHFGTHGTQEWTPGKDRGLAATDYPFLAIGDLPVFYPYIQDNVAEAIQTKRRGRAVTVSHQTPPFAPAGLYDELRDLHDRIHEYGQLEDGAVRERTAAEIRARVTGSNLHRDMGWDEARMERDFPGFLAALHDHVHELARHAMPLGLHTFGAPASPQHRLLTVMQQLGQPFYQRLGTEPDEFFAVNFEAIQESAPYRLLHRHLREGAALDEIRDPELRAMVERAGARDRHLAETGEIEALLTGLAGGFVAPGPGGDPVRNPEVPSGRNLFPFEPDKVPSRAAYEAGGKALHELIAAHRAEHGTAPEKLAFSLWSGETMRNHGVLESQALHALGLRPVWNEAGRVAALEVVPVHELGRPRIDAVLQVTSVYRDQFDGFMRLLAGAIERLAALDEPDNPVARNSAAVAELLRSKGVDASRAAGLAASRLFSNAPGDYGTSLPGATLASTTWEGEAPLAESFLARLQYAYGRQHWGAEVAGVNLFATQLKGAQAAVLSRSSRLHGLLSTDHPFEYLGGLSLAIRHIEGRSPALYVLDLRESLRVTSTARMLADEMRARYLNPHWVSSMQAEGYAGTLEVLKTVNNLWGWQVVDPGTVRADQWQAVHDTFIRDVRKLDLAAWFARHNPTAEAQIIERMLEAIRKGYWGATRETRQELAARWRELNERHGVDLGAPATRAFVAQIGFGLLPREVDAQPTAGPPQAGEAVRGAVLQPVAAAPARADARWATWLALLLLLACLGAGAAAQIRFNARIGQVP